MIRVLLVDDHAILREGLRRIIDGDDNMTVVGEADSGRAALDLLGATEADVVVMDVEMSDLNGIEATKQILKNQPQTHVIALSRFTDREIVEAMLAAGALGFLNKQNVYEELKRGILQVSEGGGYLGPKVSGTVVRAYASAIEQAEGGATEDALSSREREVLQLIVEGHSTEDIATRLHISTNTVGSHRQNLMRKLDIHSIPELTKYAVRNGLTPLE